MGMNRGQRIKQRRKELGLSAEKLAEKLGVAPSTIYRYEAGKIEKLDSEKLEPIAEALLTTPGELMGWDKEPSEDPAPDTTDWVSLAPGFKTLPIKQQESFKAMLNTIWDNMYKTATENKE